MSPTSFFRLSLLHKPKRHSYNRVRETSTECACAMQLWSYELFLVDHGYLIRIYTNMQAEKWMALFFYFILLNTNSLDVCPKYWPLSVYLADSCELRFLQVCLVFKVPWSWKWNWKEQENHQVDLMFASNESLKFHFDDIKRGEVWWQRFVTNRGLSQMLVARSKA